MESKLILSYYEPSEGSDDMGYSPAWGYKIYQEGQKFFIVDRQEARSEVVTRMDGSSFNLDHSAFGGSREVPAQAVKDRMEEAKKDRRYTIHHKPSFSE